MALLWAPPWAARAHTAMTLNAILSAVALWAGLAFGARAPDWLEMAWFCFGKRESLIPHRTLTHWPVLWITALAGALWFTHGAATRIQGLEALALLAFVIAGMLHIAMDALTPMGVPLLTPFGKRYGVGAFSTGRLSEGLAVLPLMGMIAGAGFVITRLCV